MKYEYKDLPNFILDKEGTCEECDCLMQIGGSGKPCPDCSKKDEICENCGRKKGFEGEGDYLEDGRWFCCWNCRTQLIQSPTGAKKMSDAVMNGIVKATIMKEALASCQMEGIGLDLTLEDLYLDELKQKKEKKEVGK